MAEQALNEIQLYRRSFASIYFTVCQTSDELRLILDDYVQIKRNHPKVFTHLFVRYRTNSNSDDDDFFNEEKLSNEIQNDW